MLALLISNDDLIPLESALTELVGPVRLPVLMQLCWHLRQRDCSRALRLSDEVEKYLSMSVATEADKRIYLARLCLARGEIKALFADLSGAYRLAKIGLDLFHQTGNTIGIGDANYLLSFIESERGADQLAEVYFIEALQAYKSSRDSTRIAIAHASRLALRAFVDPMRSASGLLKFFPATDLYPDLVTTWISCARANVAGFTDDPTSSIKYDLQAHHLALGSGQIRQAILCAANAGETFGILGNLDDALEWSETALTLARASQWPGSIGICLMQVGDVLRLLSRHEEAKAFLHEALEVMQPFVGSHNYELVRINLGQLALDAEENETALKWFLDLEESLLLLNEVELTMKIWRGMASALSRLGRHDEGKIKASAALQLAQEKGNLDEQIRALCIMAELHREAFLKDPVDTASSTLVLQFLHQAMALAEKMDGYTFSTELWEQAASAHADCGDFRSAYDCQLKATHLRQSVQHEEAQKRAMAMKIKQEIDLANIDSEHLQKLSITLQETNATLETLGLIGRKITASLDVNAVFEALHRHVGSLLDATTFVVYLLDQKGKMLNMAFGVEDGKPFPVVQIALDNPDSFAVRCARERRELVIDLEEDQFVTIPGTMQTRSVLFAPLETGKHLLGVMTIQSPKANTYGERECAIFRTLCAYGAIALDNANAYSAVEAARHHSAQQQQELRLAATAFETQEGMLVADAERSILRVNNAFTQITGYAFKEVLGKNPSMVRAHHDPAFFAAMWESVDTIGRWQGETLIRHKAGHLLPLWLTITAVQTEHDYVTHYVYSLIDITDRKLAEEEIHNLAYYDPLTKLPNRRLLMDRLGQALIKSARHESLCALLYIDLDNFKKLNDTRGHYAGDLLLEQVAKRLTACLREADTVARLGGDEFIVLLEDVNEKMLKAADMVESVASKILYSLNQVYFLDGIEHSSTPSIGICLFKGKETTIDELLKQADLAMYQAKEAGRNTFRFFDPDMQNAAIAHAALEADLRLALTQNQFVLHYQVQMDASGFAIGAEALVRWNHPQRGMIPPGVFISLAEDTGLILPLGKWILEAACDQIQGWAAHPETAHLTIAVNISARQFHDDNFVEQVLAAVAQFTIDPSRLKLELTESLLLADVDSVIAKMNALKANGISFSLDDFGTGYSSLSYLKRLPLSQLKIDQSFVRDIMNDANDAAIVTAILTLGHSLGLSVIAEGVETNEQRQFLEACGCIFFQGYFFGKPVPAAIFSVKAAAREGGL